MIASTPRPNCFSPTRHETQAREHLDAGIAALPKLKRPRLVKWVSELPLTATGKLQRGKLKQQYLGGAA